MISKRNMLCHDTPQKQTNCERKIGMRFFNFILSNLSRFLGFMLLLFVSSCITIYNQSSLDTNKIVQRSENRDIIQLNGYYCFTEIDSNQIYLTPMLLYEDGYMHEIFSYPMSSNEKLAHQEMKKKMMQDDYFYPLESKSAIWGWGIWWIELDNIYFQNYTNVLGDYDIRYRYGKVVNDSTFIITKDSLRHQKPIVRYPDRKYIFKQFDQKPDSVNYIMLNIEDFGNNAH